MYFDFFNYTFSAVVSLVTAVFGLSYPLLIESIHKIDIKYGSIRLKNRFEESEIYKNYNTMLKLSVFIAVIMPFLLAAFILHTAISYVLITIQVALLLILIYLTFCLVEQIQMYNDPVRLMNDVLSTATESDIDVILDIMRYASKEFPDVYRQGMYWILDLITQANRNYGKV